MSTTCRRILYCIPHSPLFGRFQFLLDALGADLADLFLNIAWDSSHHFRVDNMARAHIGLDNVQMLSPDHLASSALENPFLPLSSIRTFYHCVFLFSNCRACLFVCFFVEHSNMSFRSFLQTLKSASRGIQKNTKY